MAFTLIIGPMKSGKSSELIARIAPYEFTNKQIIYIQPLLNVRDKHISSRLGIDIKAQKVKSLKEVTDNFDIIGIDEAHMLKPKDYLFIKKWLEQDKEVIASALDLDYRRKLIPIIGRFFELRPDVIITKKAVCDICKQYNADYGQILFKGKPILSGLPAVVPEDGTYEYQVRCRKCHIAE